MSKVYDNWERLVDATLKRENLREIALAPSFSSSISDDYSKIYPFLSDGLECLARIHLFEDEIRKAIEATLKGENLSQIARKPRFSSSTSDYSKRPRPFHDCSETFWNSGLRSALRDRSGEPWLIEGLARIQPFEKGYESQIVVNPNFSSSTSYYSSEVDDFPSDVPGIQRIELLTERILQLADEFRKAMGIDSMHPFIEDSDMKYLPLLSRALTQLYERKNGRHYHRGFPQNFTFIVKLYRRFSLGSWDP